MFTTRTKNIIALLLSFTIGAGCCYLYLRGDNKASEPLPSSSDSKGGLLSTTRIHAETKDNPKEEDLVLSNKYVAVINGEKVSVPIVKRTAGTINQPDSTGGSANDASPGVKATVEQTIDLTPVLSKLHPSWEMGVGVSYVNERAYVPLSIQRNYQADKALELTVLVDTDGKAKGAMVQHKWLIK